MKLADMKFIVHDRESIEHGIVAATPYVLVSIRDPDKPEVRVRRPAGMLDALFLAFHDAEPVVGFKLPNRVRLMLPDDAEKIWAFARQYKSRVGTIVCHCEQGMSRSPAVAIALAEALRGDADAIRAESQPNQYVYELLRDAIAHSAGEE